MALLDIDYPRAVLLALLIVVNLALVGTVSTSAAPYGPYNGAWDGGSTLRTTVADTDATVELGKSTADYEDLQPGNSIAFVVAPQEPYRGADLARVRQFVTRGGALVVASDDNRTNRLLEELDATTRIRGPVVRDEQHNYRNASLPVANNLSSHPYTDDVDGLTLNYGTVLELEDSDADLPARFRENRTRAIVNTSGFSYLDRNGNQSLDGGETLRSYPVVAVERVGEGRVVVVSDASVFTNAMLDREGNRQFLQNVAGAHEQVLLDYSHGHALPPLMYALLVVRDAPLLQFLLGFVAVGAVTLWAYGPDLSLPGWSQLGGQRPAVAGAEGGLSETELAAFLRREHPEWDADRVERVTKAIIRRRGQTGSDD